jgi:glucose/arabinose dehydrogenase
MRIFLLLLILIHTACSAEQPLPLEEIKLPDNFKIALFATVPGARSLAVGDKGTIFVGTRDSHVYAVLPELDSTGKHKVILLAKNLDVPNGVAFAQGNLYVAEPTRIVRYDNIESHLYHVPKPNVIYAQLPRKKDQDHYWRYLRVGPDQKLYVSIGSPCNVCVSQNSKYATIMRMNLDGSKAEIFARGVRNSMGFDWHPQSKEMWFTENGRDWLGDNLPPDELNIVTKKGEHFGFPYCYGQRIPDTTFDAKAECRHFVPATFDFPAHVAPLGMIFYQGNMFPKKYQQTIFVALHGSWNSSKKVGYQIAAIHWDGNKVMAKETFAQGWLQDEKVWGRPVDIAIIADGSMIVSDDNAGVLYRITAKNP